MKILPVLGATFGAFIALFVVIVVPGNQSLLECALLGLGSGGLGALIGEGADR